MKALILLLLVAHVASAQTVYYIKDSTDYRLLPAIQLMPRDTVAFQRGQTFYGTLRTTDSVIYTAYGTGAAPIISGFAPFTFWQSIGGAVYETPGSTNMVLINGKQQPIARHPNLGYFIIASHTGNTSISSVDKLFGSYTGGEIVMRKKRWVYDRNLVTGNDSTRINYTPVSGSATQYNPQDKWGYFIQNNALAMDKQGEWVSAGGKVKMYLPDTSTIQSIQIATAQNVIVLSKGAQLIGLRIEGSNHDAVLIQGKGARVVGCAISYAGHNGIGLSTQADSLTITGNAITQVNNSAISTRPKSNGSVIIGNTITRTGLIVGAGDAGDLGQEAIMYSGSGATITGNTIKNVGYTGIRFSNTQYNLIKNNYIDSVCMIKDDGSHIYTWNNGTVPDVASGNIIRGNILLNAIGNAAGANSTKPEAYGIYMDDNAYGVTVEGNTIVNAYYAIVNHNGHDITYRGNTMYKSRAAAAIWWKDRAISVKGLNITGNIFYGSEVRFWDVSGGNSISGFGVSDSNYYKSGYPVNIAYPTFNATYTNKSLTDWRAMYGKDRTSKTFSGTEKFIYTTDKAQTFKLDRTYKDHTGKYYSGSITLPPYSSKILIK